jgi:hypothetical protein
MCLQHCSCWRSIVPSPSPPRERPPAQSTSQAAVAAVEQQQQEPGLVSQVRRQAPRWEPQPNSESQPEAAPQELHYYLDSNSAPAHQPEPEQAQALSFCIRSK